jgi:hypothetical protein
LRPNTSHCAADKDYGRSFCVTPVTFAQFPQRLRQTRSKVPATVLGNAAISFIGTAQDTEGMA